MAVRVLHVLNSLGGGGAESFILNLYRNMDTDKIKFDFLLRSENNNPDYISEVKNMGSKVYIIPSFPRHFIRNYVEAKKVIYRKGYDIIHVHANSLIYIYPFILSKKAGVACRILHSHNSTTSFGVLCKAAHYFNRLWVNRLVTDKMACGRLAGTWMFGDKPYKIIHNAIDINKYAYNEETRIRIRKELKLENQFVIGCVGRFTKQKNHTFLLNVFRHYLAIQKDAVLLLAGDGELLDEVKNLAAEYGIAHKVRFMGQCLNVNELLQAMDLFLMTSFFEGLPFALVEAQAAGLKIISSDTVTNDVNVTGLIKYISLNETAECWADKIEKYKNEEYVRRTEKDKLKNYDIGINARKMERYYVRQAKKG